MAANNNDVQNDGESTEGEEEFSRDQGRSEGEIDVDESADVAISDIWVRWTH